MLYDSRPNDCHSMHITNKLREMGTTTKCQSLNTSSALSSTSSASPVVVVADFVRPFYMYCRSNDAHLPAQMCDCCWPKPSALALVCGSNYSMCSLTSPSIIVLI